MFIREGRVLLRTIGNGLWRLLKDMIRGQGYVAPLCNGRVELALWC